VRAPQMGLESAVGALKEVRMKARDGIFALVIASGCFACSTASQDLGNDDARNDAGIPPSADAGESSDGIAFDGSVGSDASVADVRKTDGQPSNTDSGGCSGAVQCACGNAVCAQGSWHCPSCPSDGGSFACGPNGVTCSPSTYCVEFPEGPPNSQFDGSPPVFLYYCDNTGCSSTPTCACVANFCNGTFLPHLICADDGTGHIYTQCGP
jgi:hypothetical protein